MAPTSNPTGDGAEDEADRTTATETRSKVARLIARYDLSDLGAELEELWSGEDGTSMSLRDLETLFNKRLIEAVLRAEGADPMAGEIDSIYQALGTEEASGSARREIRARLRERGVDVDALETDLVSYQAIRTYLTGVRGVEYESADPRPVESAAETIQRLTGRLQTVATDRLESLEGGDAITLGDHRVLVTVQVYCSDCGRQYDVETLLEQGGCRCGDAGES